MRQIFAPLLAAIILVFCNGTNAKAGPLEDAISAYESGDYATALRICLTLDYCPLRILRPLAEQGAAEAQYILGLMFTSGQGVNQNYGEALKWFKLAADQGLASAQYNLGWLYRDGRGVPQNYKEAAKWYRLAAENGNLGGQQNLGYLYCDGMGVPQDHVRCHMWLNLSTSALTGKIRDVVAASRDDIAKHMTQEQLAKAQEMAVKCQASNFKDC